MKKLLFSLVLILGAQHAMACQGEAQIIGRVSGTQIFNPSACFVSLDPNSVRSYQENGNCPLDLSEVISAGIEVGLRKEDTCNIQIGEELSGVVFKDVDGTIRIQR